jgi:hypothetical protein
MQTYYCVVENGDYEGCDRGLYCDPDLLASAQAAGGAPVAADAVLVDGPILTNPALAWPPGTNLYIPAWTANPLDPDYQLDPTTYYREGTDKLTAEDRKLQAQFSIAPDADTPVNVNVSYAAVKGVPTLIVHARP